MIGTAELQRLANTFPVLRSVEPALVEHLGLELAPEEPVRAVELMQVRDERGVILGTGSRLLAVYMTAIFWKRMPTIQTLHYAHIDRCDVQGADAFVHASPPSARPDEVEENTFRFASPNVAAQLRVFLTQVCPRLGASTPSVASPSVAPSTAVHGAPPVGRAYDDVIRSAIAPERGSRVHLAEDLPAKKQAEAQAILAGVTTEPVVAFLDMTLFGGGANAIILTSHWVIVKDIDERAAFPLQGIASPMLVGALHDRIQLTRAGQVMSVPCGNHGELLQRVLASIAMTA